jgi:hypothetical protein
MVAQVGQKVVQFQDNPPALAVLSKRYYGNIARLTTGFHLTAPLHDRQCFAALHFYAETTNLYVIATVAGLSQLALYIKPKFLAQERRQFPLGSRALVPACSSAHRLALLQLAAIAALRRAFFAQFIIFSRKRVPGHISCPYVTPSKWYFVVKVFFVKRYF